MAVHARDVALLGGALCLDFANTVDYRGTDREREILASYADLVLWSEHVGTVATEQAGILLAQAKQRPREAEKALECALALREATYRIFASVTAGRSPDADDLDALNCALSPALAPASSGGPAAGLPRRRKAKGTTNSESVGAATIPSATASWPLATPSATAKGNAVRETDSETISRA